MADKFRNQGAGLDDPAGFAFPITKNDVTIFAQPTRYLYVGTGGNVKVMMTNKSNTNTVVTFANVVNGTTLKIRVQRVYSGNTTASGFIGLY